MARSFALAATASLALASADPNGIGCDLCKEAVGKAIDAGAEECKSLCKKAGPLEQVCEQACDLVETECDGSVDCASKVCGLVHLCDKTVQADRNGATTLNLTWKSCGGSATIDSVTPASIQTGTTTTITGEGSTSESVTGGSFSANVKAGPVKLASCAGKLGEEKKCPLPLGSGSITLDKIPLPISGKTSLNMDIQLSGSLPAMLLHTVTHLEATDQDGKPLVCLDVTLAPAADANSTIVV